MKITQYYPLIQVDDVAATAAFYAKHFDFAPAFESDWYVHLQSESNPAVNLAILESKHETIPEAFRGLTSKMFLSFEVDDVDAVHAEFRSAQVDVVQELRDEPHGQRHFIARGPGGILLDIIKPIPPSEEFLAQYRDDAIPQ